MAALFDTSHFKMMTGDDQALQAEIAGLFRGQAERWMGVLVPETPAQLCRDTAHTLKGSARGIGLWALADACAEAEARAGQAGASEALRVVREALAEGLEALDAHLSQSV
jgi:HPt (histidine-containing phosphotransfer) domain-containing protein